MVEYSFVVTHDPDGGATNLSNDIEEIEAIDTGTGEIKSAKLKLNSSFGLYITSTPVIVQFDKIKIAVTDEDSVTYTQIYEVDKVIPVKNAGEGITLELELLGQEHYLQKIDIPIQRFFASATTVTKDIGDFYNDINGTSQPDVQNHDTFTDGNNELPRWSANDYEFNFREIKAYDALLDVVERLGASVAAGGAGDFFELYFDSNIADTTKINFQAFASGSDPAGGSEITITDSVSVNEAPTEGGIDSITGTLVKAWGKKGEGTLPQSVESFRGELEAFLLQPDHIVGVTYPVNAFTQKDGTHFKANTETSTTPPGADWTARTFDQERGAANGYSEWTESKVDEWKSSGSDPSNTQKGLGCWDSNLVIEDGTNFQTWVHKRSTTDNFDVNYKYGAIAAGSYRGLRALVNGTGINVFAQNGGNDRFGKAYSNNIVVRNGNSETGATEFKNWDVLRVASNSERCAVRDEGRIYEKQAGVFNTDISGNARENHCFHIVQTITNVAGYNSTSDGVGIFGDNSAVEWNWEYTAFDTIPAGLFTSDGFYKIGAWANWSVPFPENSFNANTLGELYGNNSTKKEPVTIDVNGMHLTRSGNVGFNNTEAKDHGTIEGIQFWNKFKWTDAIGTTLQGDFKMRCFMYDTSDNVVVSDYTIPFNDLWHFVKLPFSQFKPYRGRIPLSLGNIAPNLFTKDLEILNVFQWKNIKLIGIQWQEVYDNQGRFSPEGTRAIWGAFAGTANIRLTVDAFVFTKPLLAVTATVADRPIEPTAMEFPDVSNSVQLDQIVNSQLEIEKFPHKEFIITTTGKFDINFGDTFFLTDSNLVNDADTRTADSGGSANTIRLVAKRIVYRITKRAGTGAGTFLRTIIGIKRIIT